MKFCEFPAALAPAPAGRGEAAGVPEGRQGVEARGERGRELAAVAQVQAENLLHYKVLWLVSTTTTRSSVCCQSDENVKIIQEDL